MRMLFVSSLSLLLGTVAWADGPPIDPRTGEITYPHTVVDLTDAQANEFDTVGTVTLNPDQWASIRKVSNATPRRIPQIIPIDWNDCLCCVHANYGIALGPRRLAVLHRNWSPLYLARQFGSAETLQLRIDRRGQFYYQDALLPYQTLLGAVSDASEEREKRNAEQGTKPYFYVLLPNGMDSESVTLKSRLSEVYDLADRNGWETPPRGTDS